MTNKAILVVHSENITLKTTETDKKPIFVQCPRVTNMTNVVYCSKQAPKSVQILPKCMQILPNKRYNQFCVAQHLYLSIKQKS